MHSKLLFIFFSQKQAPVKEDHINNSFSTKQAIDAHIKFLLNMKYEIAKSFLHVGNRDFKVNMQIFRV